MKGDFGISSCILERDLRGQRGSGSGTTKVPPFTTDELILKEVAFNGLLQADGPNAGPLAT